VVYTKSRAELTIGYRPNPNNHDKRVNIIILFTADWDGYAGKELIDIPGHKPAVAAVVIQKDLIMPLSAHRLSVLG